jgi:hypothetical protein
MPLTLTLGTTSAELKKFTSYTPRIEVNDQRPNFRHTINLNSLITAPSTEAKNLWSCTAIGDEDFYFALSRLRARQAEAVRAGTFAGITLTDEIDKFIEFAASPTRQSVGGFATSPDGAISYFAKFLVGATIEFGRIGRLYTAAVTLTELGKLAN